MNPSPILVLQMQRMGDMVLSFPLLGWLGAAFPGHPLWVVGERRFYEPLLSLSPTATYFTSAALPGMGDTQFASVINISHRPEAAHIAASVRADHRFGPWLDKDGRLFISGNWQLYRAALTHNNRYNLYHWADLNALDCVPPFFLQRTEWPRARAPFPLAGEARIGLFLGASEAAKHPDARFWAALARLLLQAGHKPVLLGGKAELPLGNAVAAAIEAPFLNLCDRFDVKSLARFIRELDLLVTPDTGPMHIAVWLGTPTLNLSMGPVNPWETGPFAPGHHIVRPFLDCAGCWACIRKKTVCHALLTPESVAAVIFSLLDASLSGQGTCSPSPFLRRRIGNLEILRSGREYHGLYQMEVVLEPECPQSGEILVRREISRFWRAWFGALFKNCSAEEADAAWSLLGGLYPDAAASLARGAAVFARLLAKKFRSDPGAMGAEPDFWRKAPLPLHPLSGYIQMYVQNAGDPRSAHVYALSLAERLAGVL